MYFSRFLRFSVQCHSFLQVLPDLDEWFLERHAKDHSCELCRVPVLTLDAKFGMACRLCNHRQEGGVHLKEVDATVLFGCQKAPVQGGLYCAEHLPSLPPLPLDDGARIRRHRHHIDQVFYQFEGSSTWHSGLICLPVITL